MIRSRMFILSASKLTIHFFFKPHLRELTKYFDQTLAYNPNNDSYLPSLNLPIREHSIPIMRKISLWYDLKALLYICYFLWREKFDIVVTVVPKAGLLGMIAAWLMQVPLRVHIFQGEVWASRRGLMRWLLKTMDTVTARLATHLLVVSASELEFLERESVIPVGKAKLLGEGSISGVDVERFQTNPELRTLLRNKLKIPENAVLCVFLGRLNIDKGIHDLVKAFTISGSYLENIWLIIAGPDEDNIATSLLKLVPDSLLKRILIFGFTDKPEDFLAASDLLCLPSYREGFGTVILEAAAMALPAIGTKIYGISDAIHDKETGVLIPVGDVQALSEAISRWCQNPEERKRLGANARDRVVANFDQKKVVERYVRHLVEVGYKTPPS